jgi:hypothetical protein
MPHYSAAIVQKGVSSRVFAWVWERRQFAFLLLLDIIFFSAWSTATGIAPAGDIRAHIFRTLEFAPGISAGDYTAIQYHGYAFLANYGVGFYAITWALYSFLSFFVAAYRAATISCNVVWVLTPFILAISSIKLADELGMTKSKNHRLMQTLLGAAVLLLPGGAIDLAGASPYILSFAFSLSALVYGLRSRDDNWALVGLLTFSALSIFTESFGYFFIATVSLALIMIRRSVIKILPVLAAVCAFSWVQLLDVGGYSSPYIEYVTPFGISFLAFFSLYAVAICAYSYFLITAKTGVNERSQALLLISWITFLAVTGSVIRASFGLNLGVVNSVFDNVLPWRLLFLNLTVLFLITVYAFSASSVRYFRMSKILVAITVFLILVPIGLRIYPVSYDSLPSASYYSQFAGDRVLVVGSALTMPSSLVTYSPAFGYSTVSGPFAQGDPSFFSITAYYEWSPYFVGNSVVANNLMHLTGANVLLTSVGGPPMAPSVTLGESSIKYSQAVAVTPLLLEARNASEALQFALFVNLLGRDGFLLDFVTSTAISEVYGVVILNGYDGTVPSGLPVFYLNSSEVSMSMSVPLIKPFVTPPFDFFGPITNSTIESASKIAASIMAFFHPLYEPAGLSLGPNSYSVTSNYSLPIQLAVSYYPYFEPNNYAQNIYHFILLPRPESIAWRLPLYDVGAIVSLISFIVVAAFVAYFRIASGKKAPNV